MKMFLYKSGLVIALLLVLLVAVAAGTQHFLGRYNKHYLAVHLDKIERLKETRGKKRIVFIGGSNISFALDSKSLADSLGYEVVNLGFHSALLLHNEILMYLRFFDKQHDVIIVSPEFHSYDFEKKESTISLYCKSLEPLRYPGLWVVLYAIQRNNPVTVLQTKHARASETVYHRDNFNKYGDYVHYPLVKKDLRSNWSKDKLKIDINANYDEAILFIKTNLDGYNYYIVPPVVNDKWLDTELAAFDGKMETAFGTQYLMRASDRNAKMNDSFFYDTRYHLAKKGKRIYTRRVLSVLKTVIPD